MKNTKSKKTLIVRHNGVITKLFADKAVQYRGYFIVENKSKYYICDEIGNLFSTYETPDDAKKVLDTFLAVFGPTN